LPAMAGVVLSDAAVAVVETQERLEPLALGKAGEAMRAASKCLILLNGGLRARPQIEQMLDDGVMDAVGFGEAFCADPDFARALLCGDIDMTPGIHDNFNTAANPLLGMVQKLEDVAGLRDIAVQEMCALAVEDLSRGAVSPKPRSAAQALRDLARNDRAVVKGLAA